MQQLERLEAAKEKADKIKEYQEQVREKRKPKVDANLRAELKQLMAQKVSPVR